MTHTIHIYHCSCTDNPTGLRVAVPGVMTPIRAINHAESMYRAAWGKPVKGEIRVRYIKTTSSIELLNTSTDSMKEKQCREKQKSRSIPSRKSSPSCQTAT